MPKCFAFLVLILLTNHASAQAPDMHQQIRTAMEASDTAAAVEALQRLRAADAGSFEANNYEYLLARLLEENGDIASAAAGYQAVAMSGSVLREYALLRLSRLMRAAGNLHGERIRLREILAFYPESLIAKAARERLRQSYFESGDHASVIDLLEQPQPGTSGSGALSRGDNLLLAEAYFHSGGTEKAREIFTELAASMPDPRQPDDIALAAVRRLDMLDGSGEGTQTAPKLAGHEHLRRAEIYQFNRDFPRARAHFAAIISEHPDSGLLPDAIHRIGRGYTLSGEHTEAVKYYERLLDRFAGHDLSEDALLQAASAYTRLGKHREAVTRYQRYIENYPQGERLDRAYLNIIDALRDSREDTEALQWAARTQEAFRGKPAEAAALFAEAKILLARSDWNAALAALDKLLTLPDLGERLAGGTNRPEAAFLRAYVLEQARRYPEAVDAYLAVPDGRNEYYGEIANERLRGLWDSDAAGQHVRSKLAELKAAAANETGDRARRSVRSALRLAVDSGERKQLLGSLGTLYKEIPAYRNTLQLNFSAPGRQQPRLSGAVQQTSIASELLFLALYDEAAPEFEWAARRSPAADAYTLAVIYNRGGRGDRAAEFIEPRWKMPADFQPELMPAEIVELLYPAPYRAALLKHAPPRNVDPRFLLAIMRQESRFRPGVKSASAARGLMQFISATASRIAAELELDTFRQDDLYDPSTAILFGSQYTSGLFRLFPNQPPAVAASYNGGEDNMARWLARSRSDQPALYVPEIAFVQSKDYVYRVMANYRMYRLLYDENLQRR